MPVTALTLINAAVGKTKSCIDIIRSGAEQAPRSISQLAMGGPGVGIDILCWLHSRWPAE